MAKQKSPPLHFKSYLQRKDGSGYDLFEDVPIEERRKYWTKVSIELAKIEAESKGLTIEIIECTPETA